MDEQAQIEQLQRDLLQAQQQLKEQQQDLNRLQQRLRELSKGHGVASVPSAQKNSAAGAWSSENFIGLRLIHLVGIVVLVIGLSIGVKYAIDRQLISEGLRIGLAYGAGAALFVFSLRLRGQYEGFSAILFSGAMASLYFTTYAAFVYYAMMPFWAAFVVMVALTVFTVYEALAYNRKEIALLGLVGAYAIPFLISANAERAALFFLYIFLINTGVVYLSFRKGWKMVGSVAQALTWVLFIGWASMQNNGEEWGTGAVFLGLFFTQFLFNSLAGRLLRHTALSRGDAYQVILNNVALYISALFVFAFSFSDADIARVTLVVALLVALQAYLAASLGRDALTRTLLAVTALALFIIFIATQWDGLVVTLLWLLTAVVVFAYGVVRRSAFDRMVAMGLMGLTLLKLVVFDSLTFTTVQKVISYLVLGVLLLVVSFFYQRFREKLFSQDDSPIEDLR